MVTAPMVVTPMVTVMTRWVGIAMQKLIQSDRAVREFHHLN